MNWMRRHKRKGGLLVMLVCLVMALSSFAPRQSNAAFWCFTCCAVELANHGITSGLVIAEHTNTRIGVFGFSAGTGNPVAAPNLNRLQHYERYLIDVFFYDHILPALMMMSEQMTTISMQQVMMIGTMLDAKNQLETQQLLQEMEARAHKDYHPSFGMCEIGTNTRSLAAAESKGDFTRVVINKQFMDRQLGTGGSVGAGGWQHDRYSDNNNALNRNRLGYYLTRTCDRNDVNMTQGNANTGLRLFCAMNPGANPPTAAAIQPSDEGWVNRDIDWNNTVMGPRTINVDYDTTFADSASDNFRLFQMSNYLYGHDVFPRPNASLLRREKNQDEFLDSRSVIARRSVAQNSFNAIVGLKARGTRMVDPGNPREMSSEETAEFMRFIMGELGIPMTAAAEYRQYLFQKSEAHEPPGATDADRNEISYYAQMEMLAKKIYQRPEFYTELYDKPANVKRKSAAMQAIKLMLDRDIYESQLRSEAIMSMILESGVVEEQQSIENTLGLMQEATR